MLRAVGEPRRIDRAIRRLQGALPAIPAREVRLTWRGGELRTTIHWARDDGFWWSLETRGEAAAGRTALVLGHAPDAPGRRESITCEINLPRGGADRKVAGIVAVDEAGTLYLCHSGRMGGARTGQRKAGFRAWAGDAVWRPLRWPDGVETEALVIAPLDSPRLTRLLGRFVETVHRYKAGAAPADGPALCVAPAVPESATSACDRRLVDSALHEELAKRGLFGGAADLFSLRGARPQPLFALVADARPEELALAVGSLSLASARRGGEVRPILVAPAGLPERDAAALASLPFTCIRFRWRGARAVFDGLDDALA